MGLRAKIWTDPMQAGYEITFYYEKEDKLYIAKKVELEFQEYKPYEDHPSTLGVSLRDVRAGFFQDLINELNQLGFKPKSESFLEGELEATKFHLKDMRTLLKLK